ncbi:response regulator receiver domain-containing protein [Gillisia mitskevichiae]|uniref:Response regulator receiver domain-containing protein n=1 Tax=Gillisia mitskevichiae TaxID=270921 RepID=A0A495PTF5_9FLAO|nr:response regulator [Gillisia mitskevichiae]RKS53893.1 response regulator receiver domain-containing protein [Gillisia mitskevichiae]
MIEDFKILLVEDDSIEIMKLRRTLTTLKLPHKIIEAENGQEAIEALKNNDFSPNLILLDLNMPRMNGIEFLKYLKTDEKLKLIPTVILTTSENNMDILNCYRLGISGYIIKPAKFVEYQEKLKSLFDYLSYNELAKAS